jgi:hypothetical protein
VNAAELTQKANRLVRLAHDADVQLRERIEEAAEAERLYRKARAEAWVLTEGTAKEREDRVNALTADARFRRDLADGLRRADLELVRRRSQELSVFQTLVNAHKAEAEFVRTGPEAA